MRAASVLFLAIACLPTGAPGAVYTCTDGQGRTIFRDEPCLRGERAEGRAATESAGAKGKRSTASSAAPLDRKQVERLVAALDKAMQKRDSKAVTALLAKDAVVEVQVSTVGKTAAMVRKDFAAYLAAAFAHPRYVYEAQPARVSLSKSEPSATVSRPIRESILVGGTLVVTELRERWTVEQDGRRVLIRKLRKVATGRPA
jgi:hypothetical protein